MMDEERKTCVQEILSKNGNPQLVLKLTWNGSVTGYSYSPKTKKQKTKKSGRFVAANTGAFCLPRTKCNQREKEIRTVSRFQATAHL